MDFLSREKVLFKNPNKQALNELLLDYSSIIRVQKSSHGKDTELRKSYEIRTEKIPALDIRWIQKDHSYYDYQPYYSEASPDENSLFLIKNKLFLENLKFLLQCNFHQFWNYLVFERRIRSILNGFLLNASNWYEIKYLNGEYLDLYNEIYQKIAQIYLRILTFKESEVEYMKDYFVLKLIRENNLITYPSIINIFLLYGKTCRELINLINGAFFQEKQKVVYQKELRKIFNHTLLVFEMIGGQICGFEQNSVVIPIGIRPKPRKFDPYWIDEVALYLLDTSASLNAFLSNCYDSVEVALQMGIPYRLTYFYNNVNYALYEMIKDRSDLPSDWPSVKQRIYENIGIGRSEFINIFHVFVTYLIDNIIQSLGDNEKQDDFTEQYLKLISTALEDDFFIFDYQNTHKIDIQLQTVSEFNPHVDHTRIDYILECLATLPTLENIISMKSEIKEASKKDLLTLPEIEPIPGPSKEESGPPNSTELYELIKSVLDTLPYLGDGFIAECLKYYNYNTTETISAILDESLPPYLSKFDRNAVYVPPEPEPEKPILSYMGKKPTYRDAKDLLNDKSDLQEVKDFVLKSRNVIYDIYDDEYDDRDDYDGEPSVRFPEPERDKAEPVENRFEGYELVSDPSDSSSDEERERAAARPKDAFCEDPAVARARREALYKNRGGGASKRTDVVGKPKGQGQDKSVVHSRDKKNVHKSSRANHNRKSGAQWKRNKGMIPM